ncbi:MAG: hypothetical protein V1800_05870 [Candidatus Latescibacterota bacterium]
MLPERDMNFQSPITVVGNLRESYRVVKRIGWFLRAFGQEVLKTQPNASWVDAASYGRPHPGVESSGDLFEGYREEGERIPDHLRHVRKVECLGRTTRGLNLSESNFAFLLNTKVHGTTWQRDIRLVTSSRGIPCEVWQEYPQTIQMALPPQRNKCLPFYVRLAPEIFLEYATAELLDRRGFENGVQVILHANTEEMTETSLVVPLQGAITKRGEAVAHGHTPHTLRVLSAPGPDVQVLCMDGKTPLRVVLMERELAGEVWDVASPHGALVAASNLRLLESALLSGSTTVSVQADEEAFYLFLLTPSRPEMRGSLQVVDETWEPEFGLYRASGNLSLPRPQLAFSRSTVGTSFVCEAEIGPNLLDGLRDLVLCAIYEGTCAKAMLNARVISGHAFGSHLFWQIGLRDWMGEGGLLRIEFENCRKADISIRPIVKFEVEMAWR